MNDSFSPNFFTFRTGCTRHYAKRHVISATFCFSSDLLFFLLINCLIYSLLLIMVPSVQYIGKNVRWLVLFLQLMLKRLLYFSVYFLFLCIIQKKRINSKYNSPFISYTLFLTYSLICLLTGSQKLKSVLHCCLSDCSHGFSQNLRIKGIDITETKEAISFMVFSVRIQTTFNLCNDHFI